MERTGRFILTSTRYAVCALLTAIPISINKSLYSHTENRMCLSHTGSLQGCFSLNYTFPFENRNSFRFTAYFYAFIRK